jgi:hemolysin activation/secretion protein
MREKMRRDVRTFRLLSGIACVFCAAKLGADTASSIANAADVLRAAAGRERETRERLPDPTNQPAPPPREWTWEWLLKTQTPKFASRGEGGFQATVRNALAAGDRADASHSRSLNYDRGREASDYSSASYRREFGPGFAKVGGDAGYYALNFSDGAGGTSTYVGRYRSLYGTLGYTLEKSAARQWDVATTLTWKDAEAEFNEAPDVIAERKLALLALELGFSGQVEGASWCMRSYLRQGQPWFGAIADKAEAPETASRLETWALRVEGGYYRWFPVRGRWITLATQGRAQVCADPLYSSERLSIGGHDAVRGYSAYGGDAGYFLQQSVQHSWQGGAGEWTVLFALETGDTWRVVPGGELATPLWSVTSGVGFRRGAWSLRIEASEPLQDDVEKINAETAVLAEARWRF